MIRKLFPYLLLMIFLLHIPVNAQRQARVGYIDMDYILSKLPSYIQAENSLEDRVRGWQMEIAARKLAIDSQETSLATEKVLLTPSLIEEKQFEIQAAKLALVTYQQQRFGVQGDLQTFRQSILKPIQDLVFSEVQRLGNEKGYDLILDKSDRSTTILFANKRYDLSDLIIRALSRQEMSANMGLTDEEINSSSEEEVVVNEVLISKEEEQSNKQALKIKAQEDKKILQQKARKARLKDYELRKQKLKDAKENKKRDKLPAKQKDSIPE
ncbi:MAG: hypothetical protein ACJA1V_000718 [Flavobacteriaceae bacterium]